MSESLCILGLVYPPAVGIKSFSLYKFYSSNSFMLPNWFNITRKTPKIVVVVKLLILLLFHLVSYKSNMISWFKFDYLYYIFWLLLGGQTQQSSGLSCDTRINPGGLEGSHGQRDQPAPAVWKAKLYLLDYLPILIFFSF